MMLEYDTLDYYNKNAQEYCNQTISADFDFIYQKVFQFLPRNAYILDFGCGSGRDSKKFLDLGYCVKAIDGSIEMCKLATKYLGIEVICMDFFVLRMAF